MVAMTTALERPQPNFTAIICAHKATNSENFTKIGCVISEINQARTNSKNQKQLWQLGSPKVIKNCAIRQITYDFLFDFKATICLSHSVSAIQHDEKRRGYQSTKIGCPEDRFSIGLTEINIFFQNLKTRAKYIAHLRSPEQIEVMGYSRPTCIQPRRARPSQV